MATDLYADLVAEDGGEFNSSSIDTVGYDRLNKTLFVEFQSGPAVYAYPGVEESTYNLFVTSDSLGRFYREHIADKFTSEKYDYAYINSREDEEDLSPQGDVKWLTGSNPVSDPTEVTSVPHEYENEDYRGLTVPARFEVKYTVADEAGGWPVGPFQPEFSGLSEADVLLQLEEAIAQMRQLTGLNLNYKVKAVTHYFD